MKKVLALLLAVAMVFVLAACGGGAGEKDPGEKNTGEKQVVVGINADYSTFDPAQAYEKSSRMILHEVYQTLFRFSAEDDSVIEKDLAADYTISEDGLTYVITMRQDAKAVTGKVLDAHDAEFCIKRLINLKGNPSFLADPIASVEATGDFELTIKLKQPTPAILAILCDSAFSVYDSDVAQENGATLDPATDSAQAFFDNNSIGSGPYTLVSYTPNAEAVMEKSETYVGTPAKIDRVVFKHINDSSMQLMSLQKGDIDFAFDLTASQLETLADENIIVRNYPTQDIFFLHMNVDETIGGPLANPDVRRAIAYAIDYEGLRELAGNDPSTPMNILPSGFPGYAGESKITRDLDKAKSYLEKAGYPDGFSFDCGAIPDMATDGIAFMDCAVKIQSDLKDVGITMNIQSDEVSVYLEKLRSAQYQANIGMWGPDYLDPASQLAFMPGETVGLRSNWTVEMAPELAELTAQAKVETDPEKRAEIFEQIQIMYSEIPGPVIVFVQPNRALAMSKRVQNVHYSSAYMLISHLMDVE
ncbi:MAG: ABC transporter substrate-binding protein [Firmicutes bacterium]|jgi:peptide/nickel transport system substrate-binding protein|nr:ABC transporter substrate-binding protein [Bacillota bacterium]